MSSRQSRGFTLTEMLVVISIIAILAALLLPAVMIAIRTARNSTIALEIKQLDTAIEAYRLEKGDYPPNFRDPEVVRRHITKCYPRIDPNYFQYFMANIFPSAFVPGTSAPLIDESESLVFWLGMTDTDPQYPFLSFPVSVPTSVSPTGYYPPGTRYDSYGNTIGAGKQASPKRFYDFEQTRLVVSPQVFTPAALRSFQAKFCGETNYVYIDSRSYNVPIQVFTTAAMASSRKDLVQFLGLDGRDYYAIGGDASDPATYVRPYWSSPPTLLAGATSPYRNIVAFKPANQTTFQIICAGQDRDFGTIVGMGGDTDVKIATGSLAGTNYNISGADKDNITNFSNGKMLGDLVP